MRVPRRDVDGVLLLNKPPGISSNQALQRVRRALGARKGGHTGTLDVAAAGLLPLCFGEATKFGAYLLDADKRYQAEITFGVRTTTGDREGEIVSSTPVAALDEAALARAVAGMQGPQEQVPPMHSALKRDGQPLYRLARRGIEVPRAPRRIVVHRIALLRVAGPRALIDVVCSKGTYVRSLAETLGERLGCGAHLSALTRIAVGPFDLSRAHGLDRFARAADPPELLDPLLLPPDCLVAALPRVDLSAPAAAALRGGQGIGVAAPAMGLVRLYAASGFLGVGEAREDGRIVPRRLLAAPAGPSSAGPEAIARAGCE